MVMKSTRVSSSPKTPHHDAVPSRPFRSLFSSAKPRPKSAPQPCLESWQHVICPTARVILEFAWGSAMATQTPLLHVLFQLFWWPRLLRRHRWQPGSLSPCPIFGLLFKTPSWSIWMTLSRETLVSSSRVSKRIPVSHAENSILPRR